MTSLMLKSIKSAMAEMNLNYGFISYDKSPITYPYFTGEYTESEGDTEDGFQEANFILTGFNRGNNAWLGLETAKNTIEDYFTMEGKAFFAADHTAAVIIYGSAFPIPKEDPDLKSIQINLTVKEWKVN